MKLNSNDLIQRNGMLTWPHFEISKLMLLTAFKWRRRSNSCRNGVFRMKETEAKFQE